MNPKNTDDKCFHYAVIVALNYGKIKWNPERVLSALNILYIKEKEIYPVFI